MVGFLFFPSGFVYGVKSNAENNGVKLHNVHALSGVGSRSVVLLSYEYENKNDINARYRLCDCSSLMRSSYGSLVYVRS